MSAALRPKSAKFMKPEAERTMKMRIMDNMVNSRPISRHSRPTPSMPAFNSMSVNPDAVKQVIQDTAENVDMLKFL